MNSSGTWRSAVFQQQQLVGGGGGGMEVKFELTVAGTPSSCLAPWLDTRIPSTPAATPRSASSTELNIIVNSNYSCNFGYFLS